MVNAIKPFNMWPMPAMTVGTQCAPAGTAFKEACSSGTYADGQSPQHFAGSVCTRGKRNALRLIAERTPVQKEAADAELATLRAEAEKQPTDADCARRYIRALLRRAKSVEAMEAWREATARIDPQTACDMHAAVASAFFTCGALSRTREVLERIPLDQRLENPDTKALWDDLRLCEETEELGGSVFPCGTPFDERWSGGPHFRKDLARNPALVAWYPAQVLGISEQDVHVLFARLTPEGEVESIDGDLPKSEFEASGIRVEDLSKGMFLEYYVFEDGDEDRGEVALFDPSGWVPSMDERRFFEGDFYGMPEIQLSAAELDPEGDDESQP